MTSTIKVNKIEKESGSTLTLGGPSTAVTLACGATQSGFGRTGTVDWCTTAKTSPFTSVSGNGYFLNTSGGAITITLPASPSAGDIVAIKDYLGTWGTSCKAVTIGRNSSKLNGACSDSVRSTNNESLTMIYVDSTVGWKSIEEGTGNIGDVFICADGGTKLTNGNFTTHVFTADSNFVVNRISNLAANNVADYFVVAGGGGGGRGSAPKYMAGGAGAGGFRLSNDTCMSAPVTSPLATPTGLTLASGSYPITVGAGGAGSTVCNCKGVAGTNSIFSTITSAGGGQGGGGTGPQSTGGNGGSGGGGTSGGGGGSGNTPPVSPPQGQDGSTSPPGNTNGGGAGGGAGAAAGTTPSPSIGGTGGVGSFVDNNLFGPTSASYGTPGPVSGSRYFAGGGSGSSNGPSAPGGVPGGDGGGGRGGTGGPAVAAADGTANTGGGAGGGSGDGGGLNGGAGGSGIVVIRYKSS